MAHLYPNDDAMVTVGPMNGSLASDEGAIHYDNVVVYLE
jgi:hypothetical protein